MSAFSQSPAARLSREREVNPPYRRDNLESNWTRRGRQVASGSAAELRLAAYRSKLRMRAVRAAAFKSGSFGSSDSSSSPAFWTPIGPAPLASDATGSGMQDYNWVSGRASSVVIGPADSTGNTFLVGGAYGGVWRSANAGSLSQLPGSVTWTPLIDDQPSLAVGAIALQPVAAGSPSNVILVGTGETNSSGDSYYGLGILRSSDGGSTWKQIEGIGSSQPPDTTFVGVGFSKIAFSTANPNLVVAATAGNNGLELGLEEDGNSSARGLYFSADAGLTWSCAILSDGAVAASATSVVYNPSQGALGTFYAFVRRHGLYSSADGQHFTRSLQPTSGLASANCPAGSNSSSCLIYRGEFALVPERNEMYAWIVDLQPDVDGNQQPADEGIWRSLNGGTSWTQILDNGITNCGDSAFGPSDSGCGVEQSYYNLALAAVSSGTATDLYAGAVNLYKCTIAGGTVCLQGDWINLTHVYGCNPGPLGEPAHVHPDQHGIAFMVANGKAMGYFAHDGGVSRTLDGYAGLPSGNCFGANQFDSLSQTLGSMTEFVSISVHPTNPDILLGGTQDNGSPKTSTATSSATWQNALGGDGGFNAINPSSTNQWFAANPYLNILKCEAGAACNDTDFSPLIGSSTLGGDQGGFYTPYILDPKNGSELLVGTCRVWRVSTSGTAPLELSDDFETLGTGVCTGSETNLVTALAAGGPVFANHSSVVYATTNGFGPLAGIPGGEIWVTTNAGVKKMGNVTGPINPAGYALGAVALDSSDVSGNTAYVGIMGFSTLSHPTSHLWKTSTAGGSWADWTGAGATAIPNAPVNALLVDSATGLVYAGNDVGVFVSPTLGPSWTEIGPAPGSTTSGFLPNAPVSALRIFNDGAGTKSLVASTYGRGVWTFPLSPNYSNAISNSSKTVFAGQSAIFNGALAAEANYASTVNLTCANEVPALTTCLLVPSQANLAASSSVPYTVNASGMVGDYTFTAHASGTDSSALKHDVSLALHVVDFALTAPSPNSIVVSQGGMSAASTFQVTAAGSFSGSVTLTCSSGLPSGASCSFSPSSTVNPTASNSVLVSLIVSGSTGIATGGPTMVTVAATSAGAPSAKLQTFGLTVTPPFPDFAIAVTPSPSTTAINQNGSWSGTLTSIDGYSGLVTLSCSAGAPATCSANPRTISPTGLGSPFTVTLGNATAATFNFTIQGTDGTITRATPTETLSVTGIGENVTWMNTGNSSVSVLAGQVASYTFSAAPVGGLTFTSPINFACSNLPALTSCVFSPPSIQTGAAARSVTLSISTAGPNFGIRSQLSDNSVSTPSNTRFPRTGFESTILSLFAFGCAFAAGIVVFSGRNKKQQLGAGLLGIFLTLGSMSEVSCGGLAGSSSTTPPPPTVTVTVNPGLATLFANEAGNAWPAIVKQQQFAATVSGSTNQAVTWSVQGGSGSGAIDSTGLFTSPALVPNPSTVTVQATSTLTSVPASSFVTISPATALGSSQITVTAAPSDGTSQSAVVTLIVQ